MEVSADRAAASADLAYRYASADADGWVETVARADANDVAVPVLERLLAETTGDDARYVDAELGRRRAAIERFDLDLTVVHELLDGDEVEYAVLGANVAHEHRPRTLDVLAAEREWPRVHDALVEAGWRPVTGCARKLARRTSTKRMYEHDVRSPLRLHGAVSWNGLTFVPASTVLSSRIRDGGIYYPDPVVDAVIRCARSVFESFELTLGDAMEIARIIEDDFERGRTLAAPLGWHHGYGLAVSTARKMIRTVRRSPAEADLPHQYRPSTLLHAWIQHARRVERGWYGPPLNAARLVYERRRRRSNRGGRDRPRTDGEPFTVGDD